MYTYQDFIKEKNSGLEGAISKLISDHTNSDLIKTARIADNYDRQLNETIILFANKVNKVMQKKSSAICSSFFRRLNTQRMTYSLGNGVTFNDNDLKKKLGEDFDTNLRTAGYNALKHGISFMFWNVDHVHVFPITEFAPLWDEEKGSLRAGVRYWQLDEKKPLMMVLYEEDGFTKFKKSEGKFEVVENKRSYRMTINETNADEEPEVIAEENYTSLPIIPVYGSRLKQSTLVGMRESIDAYDLIRSGFANDLDDCAEIYWIVSGAGGMDDEDLKNFMNKIKEDHIASTGPDTGEVDIKPYTQEIPYAARKEFLDMIRSGIYEDFGGLDVHTIAAGSTNDHIDAAYQPLDENADDYEYEIIQAVQNLLSLLGEKDTPIFKRNRISNQKEFVDMIMECTEYLDVETILNKLPFLTPDEIDEIIERKEKEEIDKLNAPPDINQNDNKTKEDE